MALQNTVLDWCSGHRTHHRHVDDVDKDPYSAKRGLWFSHMGWMLRNYESSASITFDNVKNLQKDPIVMWQYKYYLPIALGLRSEERRVGKECRSGWWSYQYKKKYE